MQTAIISIDRYPRVLLVLSLGLFAAAGLANTTVAVDGQTAVAVSLTVGGVFALARYAGSISRRRLARRSLQLWIAFIAVVGAGVATSTADIATSTAASAAISGVTWSTLLSAFSATAFLGFREIGAVPGDSPEDKLFDRDSRSTTSNRTTAEYYGD